MKRGCHPWGTRRVQAGPCGCASSPSFPSPLFLITFCYDGMNKIKAVCTEWTKYVCASTGDQHADIHS